MVHFDRNGFAYTMDRASGQVLVAEPFVFVNWADKIDIVTGKPVENPAKRTREGVNVLDICPAAPGGKDQQPAAFSPRTSLFYVPTNNLCMDYEALKVLFIEGAPFVGSSQVVPVSAPTDLPRVPFAYDISMGVRPGDEALKQQLERVLDRRRDDIQRILEGFGVPLVTALRTSQP